MVIEKKNLSIQILALIGFAMTIKLAFIYYTANYDQYALSSFCSINEFIDCDGAAKTNTAQFLGIPLAYWGMFFYSLILFLTFVDKLKNVAILKFLEVFKNPQVYITTLGTIAFLCSMLLAGISLFKIHKLCILCVVTYFIDFIIALIASDGMFKNIVKSFKITFFDFIDGVKKYTKTFIILMILATSFLAYTGITLKFVPHIKKRNEILKYKNIKFNPYRVKGNILGNPDGNVIVELYSDYVCPLCYINNIMIHKAIKEFANVKIIHFNYPFDKDCNKYIDISLHPNACFMSRAAIAAKKQGNYWEMASLLYEQQPKKYETLEPLIEQLGFNKQQFNNDFYSKETSQIISEDINKGVNLKIDATPTMYINGEKIVGVKPYYELREILIKHGALKK